MKYLLQDKFNGYAVTAIINSSNLDHFALQRAIDEFLEKFDDTEDSRKALLDSLLEADESITITWLTENNFVSW